MLLLLLFDVSDALTLTAGWRWTPGARALASRWRGWCCRGGQSRSIRRRGRARRRRRGRGLGHVSEGLTCGRACWRRVGRGIECASGGPLGGRACLSVRAGCGVGGGARVHGFCGEGSGRRRRLLQHGERAHRGRRGSSRLARAGATARLCRADGGGGSDSSNSNSSGYGGVGVGVREGVDVGAQGGAQRASESDAARRRRHGAHHGARASTSTACTASSSSAEHHRGRLERVVRDVCAAGSVGE